MHIKLPCIIRYPYLLFKLSLYNTIIIVFILFCTENDKTAYIAVSVFSSTVAIILLVVLVVTCIRFVNIFFPL